jgi:hypothetical protein
LHVLLDCIYQPNQSMLRCEAASRCGKRNIENRLERGAGIFDNAFDAGNIQRCLWGLLVRPLAGLELATVNRSLANNHFVHVENERADEAMIASHNPQDPSKSPPGRRIRQVNDTPARRALDTQIEDGAVRDVFHQKRVAADAEMITAISDTSEHRLIATRLNEQWHLVPRRLLADGIHLAIVRWR